MVLVLLVGCGVAHAGTLESNRYYTWRIPEPNVPVGSVIVGVQITLHNLKTANNIEGPGIVQVRLVDNPPPGWVGNSGNVVVGSLLASLTANDANSIIDLSDVMLPDSWANNIFAAPFDIACPGTNEPDLITMNAALLEYNDYAGNSTPSGLLLRSIGGKAILSRITIQLIVRAYTGAYSKRMVAVGVDVPKDLVVINAWAVKERLKLMAEFVEQFKALEARIAEAMKGD